ncbi:PIGQ [Cordylochernes scorpioides]|uniref:PIGQ n=1 Tax=Cordylochernes scorpioides TaxID=51811 RepID=A0ABY6LLK7_9ARAC|nr:PIGQ [Cordylochernes scorpioides]
MAPDSCKSPTPPASASNQTGLWHIWSVTLNKGFFVVVLLLLTRAVGWSLLGLRDRYLVGLASDGEPLYVNFVFATPHLPDATARYVVAWLGDGCPEEYARLASNPRVALGLHVTPGELGIARMWLRGRPAKPGQHATAILYPDTLIDFGGRLPEDNGNPFVEFLYHTCRRARAIESSVGEPAQSTCPNPDIDPTNQQSTTPRIRKIMEKSALVKEIGRKTTAVKFIANELYHTQSLSRKGRSLLCSLLGDWLLGVFALWFLTHPCLILDVGLVAIGMVVGLLKSLIWWLMGVPAGLKLNRPLNRALGHFFLYHIHLWKTYVYIILPAFSLATHTLPYAGLLGLSILLAALADLITIATLHIFCFYGYAAKLHAYETRCLAALWRLFRGKKWNPLRSRVDSYQYSANHLLLGTFLLTTLGFLLPTVLMYYVVFTLLRLGVLGLRGLLRLGAWVASICGAWAVVASSQPGALHLSILSSRPHQVPLLELSFTNGGFQMANLGIDSLVPPKWGTMFHDLFWGNLI